MWRHLRSPAGVRKLVDAADGRGHRATAERILHLHVGDSFVGDHGLAPGGQTHKDSPYRVTGTLRPTGAVIDRLVLTDTASVWKVHEHENAEHAQALATGPEDGA